MKNHFIPIFLLILLLPLVSAQPIDLPTLSENYLDSHTRQLEGNISITTSNHDKFERGLNLMVLREGRESPIGSSIDTYFSLVNMEGKYVIDPFGGVQGQAELVNDTTFLYMSSGIPYLWNFITNTTQGFNITRNYHHDIQYDPNSNTFMVLEDKIVPISNQTGQEEDMVVDRISHYKADGTLIREINLEDHLNFSVYWDILDRLNHSDINVFRGELDPVHSNSIDWDVASNHVYVNSRHFDQAYEFNMDTGELVYTYGFEGDFTMFDKNGVQKEALWYNAHDFTKIGDDEFLLYNNGNANFTDVADDFSTDGSSIVHFQVDYEKMEIHEIYSHLDGPDYHSAIWGAAQHLDNGNYLIGHGSYYKGPDRNNPVQRNFGGAALEVTDDGEVVWELQTPFNWGFYRIKRIIPQLTSGPISFEQSSNTITITQAYSNFPDKVEIYIGGELADTVDWNGSGFLYEISSSYAGEKDVQLRFYDLAGNLKSSSDTITIQQVDTSETPVFLILLFIPSIVMITIIRKMINHKISNT